MPKLIIHVGRKIDCHASLMLEKPLLYFPECYEEDGHLMPQHAQDTVNVVRPAFTALATVPADSAPLHVITHAQCVVAIAGELVGDGALQPEDVAVLMHGRDIDDTTVTTYVFTSDGVLTTGWPFGWFEWD